MLNKKDVLNLSDRVAVISGAASGIGLATAKLLSVYGAKVMMLDINEVGQVEAEKLRNQGRDAKFYKCDVTSFESCRKVISNIEKDYKRIDILFNNAGVTVRKTVEELEEKEWDFVLNVGLKGTYLLSKFTIPVMRKNGGGSIINTGSGWGLKGGDKAAAYCAVKGGIVNLTRAMAIDHGKDNIRVNSINPGDTATSMLQEEGRQLGIGKDEFFKCSALGRPIERIGLPEDIANAVLFLASDLSTWITGTALVVDGGGIA
ncbi:3-oxoacyl-ACP reductase [[Clostridium] sordellii]|uniref:3-oxoacyl-[acyl-carrier-protein] reductase n=1 Tax=Paraclostridium sordellii TaxID=1505 RepID=A0ABM9RLZ3_PARSO|nr:SDR family oxidoreductase [Paeniclostridium sordellii]EPZ58780.1 short chain dehydrogenase family protein [[Clostridium] sordellii ATCC 9714] [Paeniclostridium sordellii ATCC 9714]CEJ73040.1 3-oxoacyl-[acyl-carrier-protein] reductase [[Clostridium] sordellii] [Paeniclostridium sordellii]CEN68593.1 3-oxoacyl-ACP reductase [[Clostridium] sordellii] [Paeniclostridium sordellii]CEN71860.1 3-oxoacyl-ACP reductase [[Clostridium] sordellii] [Paeniclostridium sordellii]CEP76547.1 3-oxoacyl-ACP redu